MTGTAQQASAARTAEAASRGGARPPAGAAAGPAAGPVAGRRPGWRGWPLAPAPLLTLAVTLDGISAPSYWRDEAATLSATRRSLPQLLRMLGHVDAVHGLYYLLMWPVTHLLGTSELAARAPSAAAMALAALGVSATGRRLWSWQAGLAAGLVFAGLPLTSRFGQEARSYAVVTAIAVLASYLLIRALGEPRRRWFAGYGLAVAALGLVNLFGLLLVPAHAITVSAVRRGVARRWAVSAALGCAAAAPVATFAWRQRGQLAWLRRPGWHDVGGLVTAFTGSPAALVLLAAVSVAGLVIAARAGGHAAAGGRLGGWLGVPWLVVPPAVLLVASEFTPMYVIRYVVCCLPALALLAGAGITAAARALRAAPAAAITVAAAVAAVALLGLPQQRAYRQPWGHGDDIRAAATFLRAHARPGDAVVYLKPGTRDYADCYPFGFGKLRDIGLASSAVAAGALSGTQASPTTVANRLRTAVRVWLVAVSHRVPYPAVTGSARFRLVRAAWRDNILLRLYQRTAWHRRASQTSG